MVYRSASLPSWTHRRPLRVGVNDDGLTDYINNMDNRPRRRGSYNDGTSRRNTRRRRIPQRRNYADFEYPNYYYDDNYWEPRWHGHETLPEDHYYDYYYGDSNNELFQRPSTRLRRRQSTSTSRGHSNQVNNPATTEPLKRQHSFSAPYQDDHHHQETPPDIIISDEPFDDLRFAHHQQVHTAPERRHTIQEARATVPPPPDQAPPMARPPLQRRHSMYEPSANMMGGPRIMPIYGNGNISSVSGPTAAATAPWMQPVPRPIMMHPGFHVPQPMIQQHNIPRPIMPIPFVAQYPDFHVDRPMMPRFPGMVPPSFPPMLGHHELLPFPGVPPPLQSFVGRPISQSQGFPSPPTPGFSHSPAPTSQLQTLSGDRTIKPSTSSSSALPAAAAAAIAGATVALIAKKEEQKKEEQKKEEQKKGEQKKEEQKTEEPKKDKHNKEVKAEEAKKDDVGNKEAIRNVKKEEEDHKKDKDEPAEINKKDHGESSKDGEHKKLPDLKKIESTAAGVESAVAVQTLRRSRSLFGSFFCGNGSGEQPKKHKSHIRNRSLWDPQRVMSMDDAMYVEPQRPHAAPTGIYPEGHPLNQQIAKAIPPPLVRQDGRGILSRKESQRLAGKAQRLGCRRYIWCYRPFYGPVESTVVWAAFDAANQEKLERYIGAVLNNEPLFPGIPMSVTMGSEPELRGTTIVKPLNGVGLNYKSTFSTKPTLLQIRCLPNKNNLHVRGPPPTRPDMPMNSAPQLSFRSQRPQGIASKLWSAIVG